MLKILICFIGAVISGYLMSSAIAALEDWIYVMRHKEAYQLMYQILYTICFYSLFIQIGAKKGE